MSDRRARSVEELLALVDAIVYADGFDAAVTLDEAHRYARVPIDREELEGVLTSDPALREIVAERDGVYALRGREDLLTLRSARIAHARRLSDRAARVAGVVRHVPFVRTIALTGSVAAGDAGPDADVDLLLIVSAERLGTVFLVLGTISRLIGRRVLCPNYYLSDRHLTLERRTLYVGRELAQMRCLVGEVEQLRAANPWLHEMFPNLRLAHAPVPQRTPPGVVQRLAERALGGALGTALERRARRVAHARLRAHHEGDVPERVTEQLDRGIALRFHASDVDRLAPSRYATRRAELAAALVAGEQALAQPARSV